MLQPIRESLPPPPPPPPPPVAPPQLQQYRAQWAPPAPVAVAAPPAVAAPAPARSSEGVGSFVEGAVMGGFSDNHSWSATGGQVAMGFVPVLGQIADVRDTAASIGQIARGEDGGWLNLGASLVGFVPGLGDAAKAGMRSLGNATESGAEVALRAADELPPATARTLDPPPLSAAPLQPPPSPPTLRGTGGANRFEPTPLETHNAALMSRHSYQPDQPLPIGTRVATPEQVRALGLEGKLENGAFKAEIYATKTAAGTDYTVAFRGSGARWGDWVSNGQQNFGKDSLHYNQALEIGSIIGRGDANVTFTGHSLGGGLAGVAAIASGRPAITFNEAGLSTTTIGRATDVATAQGHAIGEVDHFYVPGEPLTAANRTSLVANSYGEQHALPLSPPEGAGFISRNIVLNRHGIDWVVASTAKQLIDSR